MILTDGEFMDIPEAEKAIIEASKLPLSIIIVVVGNLSERSVNKM